VAFPLKKKTTRLALPSLLIFGIFRNPILTTYCTKSIETEDLKTTLFFFRVYMLYNTYRAGTPEAPLRRNTSDFKVSLYCRTCVGGATPSPNPPTAINFIDLHYFLAKRLYGIALLMGCVLVNVTELHCSVTLSVIVSEIMILGYVGDSFAMGF
jgi:hypothetical protein